LGENHWCVHHYHPRLLRFLIYPLHAAIKDRRAIFADQQETYLLKSRLLQQARQKRDAGM